jgi:hypothetical protein
VNALGRSLSRMVGLGGGVRWLCIWVVRSKLLHGVPICTADLMASRRNLLLVRKLHRAVAIRMVRHFRTISAVAAAVLAPLELQALMCRDIQSVTRNWKKLYLPR